MAENGEFGGVIGRDYRESKPWWPETRRAREGSPNVVYVVLDDVGFAQLGCYGSDIDTPNMDRLALNGLRYTNFHTTALCSPTRSCLLTGRNHHSNGMATIIELASGYPGYTAQIPKSSAFISEILTRNGYATYAVGKWHLTPANEMHMGAPRDRWPLGRGFERFYGFIGAETHQYTPALVYDNHEVSPPGTYEEGYHLTEDITDKSIEFIRDLRAADPAKPFFLYYCPGACHAPHQAPRSWIEKYRGRFDQGWDAWREQIYQRQVREAIIPPGTRLSPRPDWVQAWETLSADEQRVYARMMEVFAGFLSHTDAQVGRLVDYLDELGELENTIIVLVSDNGASAEGGPHGSVNEMRFFNAVPESVADNLAALDELGGPLHYNHYSWGWAWAGNTPLKRWKRETHEGGVLDPMIVHWPNGIGAKGEVRRQFTHAIDVTPTILDAIGAPPPAEINGVASRPMEGASFRHSFDAPDAPSHHETQYFEMMGSRGVYHKGWKAVTFHPIIGVAYDGTDATKSFDDDVWELYHVAEDPSECDDLAQEHPQKLREMIDRWWAEAGKYNVLPIDNRPFRGEIPSGAPKRERFVYKSGGGSLPESIAPNLKGRSHFFTAEVDIPEGGAEGVLVAHGAYFGGYALYVRDRHLHYVHNYVGVEEYAISSNRAVPSGRVTLGFEFKAADRFRGVGAFFINGEPAGEGDIPRTVPLRISLAGEGFCVGYDGGLPVSRSYKSPFAFTGKLRRLIVDVSGTPYRDPEAEERIAMAEQ
ncbi:MAG: arylsulfatase [Chloroflexi bacterium]|nr:arylsulfatase [Chloroflexota bacterium]